MILRRDQFRALENDAEGRFVLRMEKHLRLAFPKQTAATDSRQLAEQIHSAIAIAKTYGLMREYDVEGYLNVLCASGARLGDTPPAWVQQVLADEEVPPVSRIEWLYRAYRYRRWQ